MRGFASDAIEVMTVADAMAERRWHAPVVDDFLRDLREVAETVARSGRSGAKRSNYAT